MYIVYILYSKTADSFYVGQTMDFENRLAEHNKHVFKNAETRKASDWKLFFNIECTSRKQAMLIEKHIKKMKSRIYFHNLKNYPEISQRLKVKYS